MEREFMEFREKTMASLNQKIFNNQPNNETHTLILQQRDQIRELQQAIRELEEDNQSLRMMLRTTREDITNIRQSSTRPALEEEVHHQPITSTAPPTSCNSDAISRPSEINPPKAPKPPASSIPPTPHSPSPLTPPKSPDLSADHKPNNRPSKPTHKEILFLCDSNGKHINMARLFPQKKSVKLWSPTTEKAMEHLSSG